MTSRQMFWTIVALATIAVLGWTAYGLVASKIGPEPCVRSWCAPS